MMSFLVGLALVIFGLQLTRGEKATPAAQMYYRILILALLLPVIGLYTFALIRVDLGEVKNEYLEQYIIANISARLSATSMSVLKTEHLIAGIKI
jgi:hypothetical protein